MIKWRHHPKLIKPKVNFNHILFKLLNYISSKQVILSYGLYSHLSLSLSLSLFGIRLAQLVKSLIIE